LQRYCPPWLWAVVVLVAVLQFAWTVWALTAAYIALGPLLWLRRRLRQAA
jgi:hypothetical protein